MKSKKAFTLIELLVVIAIIALLLSIIIPALKKVKKQASAVVCLSNMRSMSACWHAYAMDNDEKLVNGHVPRQTTFTSDGKSQHFWVEAPQDKNGVYTGDKALSGTKLTVDEEQNGIRRGLLFAYVDSVDAYHCPADNSDKLFADKITWPNGSWWNSYSITALMNGESSKETALLYDPKSTNWDKKAVLKLTEITAPGNKVVFLENGDWRGWLMGSWMMRPGSSPSWIDPFAIWHGDQSPLGFADGHAENHKWVDWTTSQNALFTPGNPQPSGVEYPTPQANETGDDLAFMSRSYVPGVN